ncbi:SYVM protein, partial [Uria aalge]|nr:SYVM protein [Uria aalge]
AVKVTPGHSPPDLALARAHGLSPLSVIGDDGTMCPPGGGWLQVLPRLLSVPVSPLSPQLRPRVPSVPSSVLCRFPVSPLSLCPLHSRVPNCVPCHFPVSP